MGCHRRAAVAARIHRVSTTFTRTLAKLGVNPGTQMRTAFGAAISSLARADRLPGPADFVARFHPEYRVSTFGFYRFDATSLDVVTVRDEPPLPFEPT